VSEKDDARSLGRKINQQSLKVQQEKRPDERAKAIERLSQLGKEYNSLNREPSEK